MSIPLRSSTARMASQMPDVWHLHSAIATIRLSPQTRSRLAGLKQSRRESYEEVLGNLLALVPEGDEEGAYTHPFRSALLRARWEIRVGRTVSHAQLKRRLGL